MKILLINAITIKEGGSLLVLTKMLEHFVSIDKSIYLIVIADESVVKKLPQISNVEICTFTWVKWSPLHLIYWYHFVLPRLVKTKKVDLLFSQTNFLPMVNISCPSLLLLHHAGYFSKSYGEAYLDKNNNFVSKLFWRLRCLWVYASVKKADYVTVQTKALANRVIEKLSINGKDLSVIPHGCGSGDGVIEPKKLCNKREYRLGFITKYGVQKNFEVIFKALNKINQQNFKIKLVLTLDEQYPPNINLFKQCDKLGISDYIENHGEVNKYEAKKLYRSLDVFIFPSLCESFGFTLVEAMYYGLPIIAADTESNVEVLGEKGVFFDANSENQLADKVNLLLSTEKFYDEQSLYSCSRNKNYTWIKAATKILALIEYGIKKNGN